MAHAFRLGDKVELIRTPLNAQRGPYKIAALMPETGAGEPQYRIRSEAPGPERVVGEGELSPRRSSVFDA
jgi:hypothetical protein